jgi:hypothetical protein
MSDSFTKGEFTQKSGAFETVTFLRSATLLMKLRNFVVCAIVAIGFACNATAKEAGEG